MGPLANTIASLIAIAIFYPYFGLYSLFILVGGVLIDVDHYLYYLFKKKDWNLKRCIKYFDPKRICVDQLHVFHTVEFWFMMILLSFYFKFIFATLVGMIFHQALDSYELWHSVMPTLRVKSIYGWLFGMHSQSYYFLKNKNNVEMLIKRGYRDSDETFLPIRKS